MIEDFWFEDGKFVTKRTEDVTANLEQNVRDQNAGDGYTPSRDMRRVASIPMIIVEKWMREGLNLFDQNDWPKIRAKLNDSEYRHLRTALGRI